MHVPWSVSALTRSRLILTGSERPSAGGQGTATHPVQAAERGPGVPIVRRAPPVLGAGVTGTPGRPRARLGFFPDRPGAPRGASSGRMSPLRTPHRIPRAGSAAVGGARPLLSPSAPGGLRGEQGQVSQGREQRSETRPPTPLSRVLAHLAALVQEACEPGRCGWRVPAVAAASARRVAGAVVSPCAPSRLSPHKRLSAARPQPETGPRPERRCCGAAFPWAHARPL